LGVEDLARSIAFYEALGWERCASSIDGVTIAMNVESEDLVQEALDDAVAAGASVLRPLSPTVFGATSYLADPDGYVWEVAYNQGFPIGPDGHLSIP
jgi:predicted lactoylglutathione lyase